MTGVGRRVTSGVARPPLLIVGQQLGVVIVLPFTQSRDRVEELAAQLGDGVPRAVGLTAGDERTLDDTPAHHHLDRRIEAVVLDLECLAKLVPPPGPALELDQEGDGPLLAEQVESDCA